MAPLFCALSPKAFPLPLFPHAEFQRIGAFSFLSLQSVAVLKLGTQPLPPLFLFPLPFDVSTSPSWVVPDRYHSLFFLRESVGVFAEGGGGGCFFLLSVFPSFPFPPWCMREMLLSFRTGSLGGSRSFLSSADLLLPVRRAIFFSLFLFRSNAGAYPPLSLLLAERPPFRAFAQIAGRRFSPRLFLDDSPPVVNRMSCF